MNLSAISQLPLKVWNKNKLSILIYHRVLSKSDPYWRGMINVDEFRSQMQLVRRFFNPVSLPKALDDLKNNSLPPRALAITFDDGYADNATNAVPILKELGLTATFFIATDFINGGAMWLDQTVEAILQYPGEDIDLSKIGLGHAKTRNLTEKRQLLAKIIPIFRHMEMHERNDKAAHITIQTGPVDTSNLMLTTQQIMDMNQAGMSIGAHTKGHPNLSKLSAENAYEQIAGSKKTLEQMLNEEIALFAYPFGRENQDFSYQHAKMVQDLGFKAAVTTDVGVSSKNTDLYRLPRFTPWDRNRTKFALRLALNHAAQAANLESC